MVEEVAAAVGEGGLEEAVDDSEACGNCTPAERAATPARPPSPPVTLTMELAVPRSFPPGVAKMSWVLDIGAGPYGNA